MNKNIKVKLFFQIIILFSLIFLPLQVKSQVGSFVFLGALELKPGLYETKDMLPAEEKYYFVNLGPGQALEIDVSLTPQGPGIAGIGGVTLYSEDGFVVAEKELIAEVDTVGFKISYLAGSQREVQKIYVKKYCGILYTLGNFSMKADIKNYFDAGTNTDVPETIEGALPVSYGITRGYLSGDQGSDFADFYKTSIKEAGDFYIEAYPLIKDVVLFVTVYDENGGVVLSGEGAFDKRLRTSRYLTKPGDYFIKLEGDAREIFAYQFELLPQKAPIVVEGEKKSIFQIIHLRFILGIILLAVVIYFVGKKIYTLLKTEE